MPLLVTDHSWTQTESMVYISVPLKGATKVDILSSDEYLKVHFPPFLLEVFLSELVDDEQSLAKIGNGVAVISLSKRTNKLWEHLAISTYDKETKKEIRVRALSKMEEKLAAEAQSRSEKKHKEKKYALKTMMNIEKDEREKIQKMKDDERAATTAELEAWQLKEKKKKKEEAQLKVRSQTCNANKGKDIKENFGGGGSGGTKVIFDKRSANEDQRKKKCTDLPAPRRLGNIEVSFTPRVFPTALRESRVAEEEEWLNKQAEARRAVNADVEELNDLTEEERNPDWLKEKGNKCFAAGNYLSALNAYNLAIRLNRKIPALYSNRAACHLKLRNLHKAIEDSSKALELLTPAVAANAAARARAHVRRGSAFCQLELYTEGLQEYQAALKIDPNNEPLQADTQKIRDIIQGSAS
uniref:dynein assembly factor 4, axonemal n=1 Tax=Doryrhamphus excisus TaxID=161450 RepID=UPI0025AE364C|nr:dynein assembly factor 4, axonemal [Doryrhamphus excisus]XP_057931230.1 dynein assembly factor 4, axonemal [Doryrhamphus excisus]XP_057931231.1 dynein assembly factor 4, axonemal [Doryrhamphus excisus]